MVIRGGYSAYSSGPIFDTTPKDQSSFHVSITDSQIQNTPYGPPYQIPATDSVCPKCGKDDCDCEK